LSPTSRAAPRQVVIVRTDQTWTQQVPVAPVTAVSASSVLSGQPSMMCFSTTCGSPSGPLPLCRFQSSMFRVQSPVFRHRLQSPMFWLQSPVFRHRLQSPMFWFQTPVFRRRFWSGQPSMMCFSTTCGSPSGPLPLRRLQPPLFRFQSSVFRHRLQSPMFRHRLQSPMFWFQSPVFRRRFLSPVFRPGPTEPPSPDPGTPGTSSPELGPLAPRSSPPTRPPERAPWPGDCPAARPPDCFCGLVLFKTGRSMGKVNISITRLRGRLLQWRAVSGPSKLSLKA